MRTRVVVVGASGRVGGAIVRDLSTRHEVGPIQRKTLGEHPQDLAHRAVAARPDVLINAAGVAHVERPHDADLQRLDHGNVDLPAALAGAALDARISMIHISTVKAALAGGDSPYATSKRTGEARLERDFGQSFADAELSLVLVRPLALLFPPLDSGRVARMRFLRWWPEMLTPSVRLPVLAPEMFLHAINELLDDITSGRAPFGVSVRSFASDERGSLRDVRRAFVSPRSWRR